MISLDDMRVFAAVAEARSFTAAAESLGISKQSVSRKVAEVEDALGVTLLERTTRRVDLTPIGASYAARCVEIVKLADEANAAVGGESEVPSGTLRISADPHFAESFIAQLMDEYLSLYPQVSMEVLLTRRKVDLDAEGFDVAFRVGQPGSDQLVATWLGHADIRYCASPAYLDERGRPEHTDLLVKHDCVTLLREGPERWPFIAENGDIYTIPVEGRVRVSSFPLAEKTVLAGHGIALFPAFAAEPHIEAGRLEAILDDQVPDVGAVWLVYPRRRGLVPRVRAFLELVMSSFAEAPPWAVRE